ncbi:hypothetical protein WJ972_20080 [Achromobacter insuavis]
MNPPERRPAGPPAHHHPGADRRRRHCDGLAQPHFRRRRRRAGRQPPHGALHGDFKRLIAEEIFKRWQIPQASGSDRGGLKEYLTVFTASVREFVKAHPGVTPYVIRRLAATPSMIAKIEGHQRHIAHAYGISREQARMLLATVAFPAWRWPTRCIRWPAWNRWSTRRAPPRRPRWKRNSIRACKR